MTINAEQKKKYESAKIPKVVYHYTSVNSLFEIIRNKSLWLTNLKSTNDKTELEHASKIIDDTINNMIQKEPDENKKDILKQIQNADDSNESGLKIGDFFSVSFVNDKNSLGHWAIYGDNFQGVCIGFNLWEFGDYFDKTLEVPTRLLGLNHSKITYKGTEQKEIIEKEINRSIKAFDSSNETIKANNSLHIYKLAKLHYAPLFKHKGFELEKEYRLFFDEEEIVRNEKYFVARFGQPIYAHDFADNNVTFDHTLENVCKYEHAIKTFQLNTDNKQYSAFSNQIRSYYALNLEPIWSSKLIPNIYLGPKCPQGLKEIELFLKANDLVNTNVDSSKTPIR